MLTKRFFISWLAASLSMFILSYIWHGIFLTDFARLSYSPHIFLFCAALVYLMIGFVVTKAIEVKFLERSFKRKPLMRGLISGALCGVGFFMIATVVGVSFSTGSKLENLALDISWQVIEQALGGVIVGVVHIFVYDPIMDMED